jgi:hypothetical protein
VYVQQTFRVPKITYGYSTINNINRKIVFI